MVRKKAELVLVIFFASGFSGLIYESVWSHYVKLFLGHAAYAQTLVLTVFIGGLAAGSWICSRIAERIRNPLRVYALIEAAIGAVALVFHAVFVATTDWAFASLLPASCDQSSTFCVSQWLLAAAMLVPQSVMLGATFPLVSSAVLRWSSEHPGNDIASLYFLNSLGAVLGVLASAFILIPGVGLPGTLVTAGVINIVIAVAAYALSRRAPEALAIARLEPPAQGEGRAGSERSLVLALLATAFLTGLSSFIYEIAWIRMLSLVLGASTHSFELMLASFILGLALGGMWVRNRVDPAADPVRLLAYVQLFMGIAAAATIPVYNGSFDLMAWTLSSVSRTPAGFVLFNIASTLIAMLVMLPATFCAGMTLPLITYRLLRSSAGEKALGMVYSVNTLGAILGIALAVHLLLTGLGVRGALVVGCVIDVALGVFLLVAWRRAPAGRRGMPWGAVAAVAGLAALVLAFDVDPRRGAAGVFRSGVARVSDNDTVIYHRDGKTATVDVVESAGGRRSIRTNGKTDAAISAAEQAPSADEYTMTLLAMLPLGHRPEAESAAVIGFGSGMSTSVLLASPHLKRVDTIEIEPAMIEGAQKFRPAVEAAFADPRSRIVIDDAKSYFARGRNRYDIVISEPSNPWVSGVASLFTEEFYRRVSGYMNEGAVLAQWLHTYEMDSTTLASILEALSRTFPEYVVYSSIDLDIVVIARKGGPAGEFQARVLDFPLAQPRLERLMLKDPRVIQRRMVASSRTLRPLFSTYGVNANSDYFPLVDQRASASRFMRSKVTEITQLQAAPVPMLEMLDGGMPPADSPTADNPMNQTDTATRTAWRVSAALSEGRGHADDMPLVGGGDIAAQMVRYWMGSCRTGPTFAQATPSLLTASDATTPYLPAAAAAALWRRVAESPCARALDEKQRRQLDLIVAVAGRDPIAMIKHALPILDDTVGKQGEMAELAVLAASTALACLDRPRDARVLLDRAERDWVRPGQRQSELRYLRGVTDPAFPKAAGGCVSRDARAPAAPAAR